MMTTKDTLLLAGAMVGVGIVLLNYEKIVDWFYSFSYDNGGGNALDTVIGEDSTGSTALLTDEEGTIFEVHGEQYFPTAAGETRPILSIRELLVNKIATWQSTHPGQKYTGDPFYDFFGFLSLPRVPNNYNAVIVIMNELGIEHDLQHYYNPAFSSIPSQLLRGG